MDDRDIFLTLEANIIDAVKKLVHNARLEFNARAQKGKIASSPASASTKVVLPTKTIAKPQSDATASKKETKEPGNMMDVFASVLPPNEEQASSETPAGNSSEIPVLVTADSVAEPAVTTPVAEPATLSSEEEAKRQLEDLATDVNEDLHGMSHMRKPAMARRKTHAGTSSRFDPHAPALPEPVVVALVPEPVEPDRPASKSFVQAGPRQPMVNLADLQKRGGARGGGPGRGGMAGRAVDGLPSSDPTILRRQTSVDSSRPRQQPEAPKPVDSPQPASPVPPEPAKLPDLPSEGISETSQPGSETEAPPLPSLPVTSLSPLRTPSGEPLEPEHLSLDAVSPRRNSGAGSVAGPRPPGGPRSPVPGPAPPPGNPHYPHTPSGHHVIGPAPPLGRVMSPSPRKISTGGPSPPLGAGLEVQVEGEVPPIPVSTPSAEGETSEPESEKKGPASASAVMSVARAKQPMVNLADLAKPRTPRMDAGKAAGPPAAPAGPPIPKCAECGCNKFVMNPFKKGTNCSTCFHQHPTS